MTKPFDILFINTGVRTFHLDDTDTFNDMNTCFWGMSYQFWASDTFLQQLSFAVCTNCFENCINCCANVNGDVRNAPKRLRKTVKGHSTQKFKFCHHLLILKMLQTCMSFCLLLNTKEDIVKNDWNFGTIDFHSIFFLLWNYGAKKLFGSHCSSKYLLLCSAEDINSYRFATSWGLVNDDRILIFGWSVPLMKV